MQLTSKVVHDGVRNASVQITGWAPFDWTVVVDASELKPAPRDIRIDAVHYAVADKTEIVLGWGQHDAEPAAALPIAGRGKLDFGEVTGIHNLAPSPNGDICLKAFGEGLFTIVLDLSKHVGG